MIRGGGTLEFDHPVREGMWIAARTRSAHTTPVYVSLDGSRHGKSSEVPRLVEKRLRELDEIERLIASRGELIALGKQPEWEAPDVFPGQGAALHKMVEEARACYRGLLDERAFASNSQKDSTRRRSNPAAKY